MSDLKDKKREARKNLADAREILAHMEKHLKMGDERAVELASAFFHIFNYHCEHGDLRPWHVHLAALLRTNQDACYMPILPE